jgi:hypothetical protein
LGHLCRYMIDYTTLLLLWMEGFSCEWHEELQYLHQLIYPNIGHKLKLMSMLCPRYLSFRQETKLFVVGHSFLEGLGELQHCIENPVGTPTWQYISFLYSFLRLSSQLSMHLSPITHSKASQWNSPFKGPSKCGLMQQATPTNHANYPMEEQTDQQKSV